MSTHHTAGGTIALLGRKYFLPCIKSYFAKAGTYYVITTHGEYRVYGGRIAGGARTDWFIIPQSPACALSKEVRATGPLDAFRLLGVQP